MDLLERERSLRTLDAALDDAVAGDGRVILVSGEAGIGKTSLIEAFVRRRPDLARVLWSACDDLFTPRPLGPFHDVAGQVHGHLAGLVEFGGHRAAIATALLEELRREPTILVVEDVHWADEPTLDLLKILARRMARTPSLLMLTYRDDEIGPRHPLRIVLGDLATSQAVRRVIVTPLSEVGVRSLVGSRSLDAAEIHRLTGGNPFFVTEVLSSVEDGRAGLPDTIRDAVVARVARLSPSAQAAIEAAAVAGPRIEPWLLVDLAGAESPAIDEALAAGVLVAQEDWLAFRHELGRRAVLESMSPAHRLALHRMALDTLRGSPATRTDLTRLAHHAAGAADGEAVLAFAPTAARQAAAAGAHRAATELFALAVRYADDLPLAEHARLRDEYSVELDTIDKKRLAVDERRTAADLWQRAGDRPHHGESLSRVAQLLQILGDPDEALALNRMALEVLETLPPDHSLITALNTQAWLCLADRGSSTEGVALAERAIAIADALGYDVELPRLYEILGLSWLYLDPAIGVGHLERGLRLAIDHELVTRASNIYSNLASILVDFHRFLDADAMFAEAFAYVTERDLDAIRQYLDGWQAVLHVHRGRWHEASAVAGRLADDPGAEAGRGMALLALGRLRARRGEPGAISALDEALVLIRRQGYRQREGLVLAARAEAHALAGNVLGASVDARDGRALAVEFHHPWYLGEHAYWQRWAGDRPDLDDWAAAPYALEIGGDWRAAADAWEAMGCPYERARALAAGDEPARLEALAILDDLGARPLADRVRNDLREAGVAAVPRGPRPATRADPFGLTARQAEILRLLVDGLTNAEIGELLVLSPKTVDNHVTAILAKVGAHSRAEAVSVALQRVEAAGRAEPAD